MTLTLCLILIVDVEDKSIIEMGTREERNCRQQILIILSNFAVKGTEK